MKRNHYQNRLIPMAILATCGVLLFGGWGCVSSGKKEVSPKTTTAIFYPPPPELPYLQYLRSYTGSGDFDESRSGFDSFVSGKGKSALRMGKPNGITAKRGMLYVSDINSTVMTFDLVKKQFVTMQGAKGIGALVDPYNVSKDADGNLYVCDTGRKEVLQYDAKDFYIKSYRHPSEWRPLDAEAFGKYLYVTDAKNNQIHVFDRDSGSLVNSFGNRSVPEENLGIPTNLAIDKDGIIYVVDTGRFQVVKFDRDGHFLGAFGEAGQNPGTFHRPKGIAIDRQGLIYVADGGSDVVQIFDNKGQILTFFGKPGDAPSYLHLASGVTLDYENLDLFKQYIDPNFEAEYLVHVVSQFGDNSVSVYAFGKQKGAKYPTKEELLETRKGELLKTIKK